MRLVSSVWQKVMAIFVCILLLAGAGMTIYAGSVSGQILLTVVIVPLILLCAIYTFAGSFRHSLVVDDEGIQEISAFSARSFKWSDVSRYEWQKAPNSRQKRIEPVLFNHSGAEVYRPSAPVFILNEREMKERDNFCQFIVSKLQDRGISGQGSITSPVAHPK